MTWTNRDWQAELTSDWQLRPVQGGPRGCKPFVYHSIVPLRSSLLPEEELHFQDRRLNGKVCQSSPTLGMLNVCGVVCNDWMSLYREGNVLRSMFVHQWWLALRLSLAYNHVRLTLWMRPAQCGCILHNITRCGFYWILKVSMSNTKMYYVKLELPFKKQIW